MLLPPKPFQVKTELAYIRKREKGGSLLSSQDTTSHLKQSGCFAVAITAEIKTKSVQLSFSEARV